MQKPFSAKVFTNCCIASAVRSADSVSSQESTHCFEETFVWNMFGSTRLTANLRLITRHFLASWGFFYCVSACTICSVSRGNVCAHCLHFPALPLPHTHQIPKGNIQETLILFSPLHNQAVSLKITNTHRTLEMGWKPQKPDASSERTMNSQRGAGATETRAEWRLGAVKGLNVRPLSADSPALLKLDLSVWSCCLLSCTRLIWERACSLVDITRVLGHTQFSTDMLECG